ncbi:beta-L-arabinofuranosidase domain-containing protein [Enterococcus sp. AZ072]|uniref:beta-L-arabinofuranosidase domain-containing protein n=1 Tax=unclassified Enterococcus TaxID=2608891 RepID=UPI003D2D7891
MLKSIIKNTQLKASVFNKRFSKNYDYMLSLRTDNLLRSYLLEAGLWSYSGNSSTTIDPEEQVEQPDEWHWGWEAVTCEIRGHFLGHWLSAAAKIYGATNSPVIAGKTEEIIAGLARCQQANGDGWVASIPEKYMQRMEKKQAVWAPHYTIHKTMMGLLDVYKYTNNEEALAILIQFSEWFIHWCERVNEETFQNILSYETGGMLEIWAELFAITKDPRYRQLIDLYYRHSFFDQLLEGKDVLTNKHANTQIAEILGIARIWEVTKEAKYRSIVEKFWEMAVEKRGTYITGGISCGELWTPIKDFSGRLGKAQEHCTVYHMIRLAHYLFKWTGDSKYGDFEELNLYNGILAQQNKNTGMVTYFLDMEPCSQKNWGDPLKHFWCCHGTLVQAQSSYQECVFYQEENTVTINQYIPSQTILEAKEGQLKIKLIQDSQLGEGPLERSNKFGKQVIQSYESSSDIPSKRPSSYRYKIILTGEGFCTLNFRVPKWSKETLLWVNNQPRNYIANRGFVTIENLTSVSEIVIEFKKSIEMVTLPGNPNRVAFIDGPLVLAGLTEKDVPIHIHEGLFQPLNERHHSFWRDSTYITTGQEKNIKFVPISEVSNETYSIYFERKG